MSNLVKIENGRLMGVIEKGKFTGVRYYASKDPSANDPYLDVATATVKGKGDNEVMGTLHVRLGQAMLEDNVGGYFTSRWEKHSHYKSGWFVDGVAVHVTDKWEPSDDSAWSVKGHGSFATEAEAKACAFDNDLSRKDITEIPSVDGAVAKLDQHMPHKHL